MPNRVTRWIRSGVELCMACLLPPDKDDLPPKARKRKKRRFWMIRRKEKVQVDPGNKEGKTSSNKNDKKIADGVKKKDGNSKKNGNAKDNGNIPVTKARPLPPAPNTKRSSSADKSEKMNVKKKGEKPRKPKISPNCKGCLNKEHNPRKIKARLSSKHQKEVPNLNNREVESKSTSSEFVVDENVAKCAPITTKPRKVVSRVDKDLPQTDKILRTNGLTPGEAQISKEKSVKDSKYETTGRQKLPKKLKKCKAAWASSPTEDMTTHDGSTEADGTESSGAMDTKVDAVESSSGESLRSAYHADAAAKNIDVECSYYEMVTSVAAKYIGLVDDDTEEELHSIKEGSESNGDDKTDGSEIQPCNIDADQNKESNDDGDKISGKPDIALTNTRGTRVDNGQDEDSHDDDDDIVFGGPVFAKSTHRNEEEDEDEDEDSHDDDDDTVIGKSDIAMVTARNDVSDDQDEGNHDDDDDIVFGGPVFNVITHRNDDDEEEEEDENSHEDDDDIVTGKSDIAMVTPRNDDISDDQDEDNHDDYDAIIFGGPVFGMATPRNDDVDQEEDSHDDNADIVIEKSDITIVTLRNDDVADDQEGDNHDDGDIVLGKSDITMTTSRNDDVDDQDEDSHDDDDDIVFGGPVFAMTTPRNDDVADGKDEDSYDDDDDIVIGVPDVAAATPGNDDGDDQNEDSHDDVADIVTEKPDISLVTHKNDDDVADDSDEVSHHDDDDIVFGKPDVAMAMSKNASLGDCQEDDGETVGCYSSAAVKDNKINTMRTGSMSEHGGIAGMIQSIATTLGEDKRYSRSCVDNRRVIREMPATSGPAMLERTRALSLYEIMTAAKAGMLGNVGMATGSAEDRAMADGQLGSNQGHSEATSELSMFERPRALSLYEMMTAAKTGMLGHGRMGTEATEDTTSAENQHISCQGYSEAISGMSVFERPRALSLFEMMAAAKMGMLGNVVKSTASAKDMTSDDKQLTSNQGYSELGKTTNLELETVQNERERTSNDNNPNQHCTKSCAKETQPCLPGSGDRLSEDPADQEKTDGSTGSSDNPESSQIIRPKSSLIDKRHEDLKAVSHKPPLSPNRRKSKPKSDVEKTDDKGTPEEPAVTKVKRRRRLPKFADDDPLADLDILLYEASKIY